MRVIVLIITARASCVAAIGALLLALTADSRASLPHDPFGGASVLLHDGANGVAAKWRDELARIAIDQEAVKACSGDTLSDCRAVLKLVAIVEEARRLAVAARCAAARGRRLQRLRARQVFRVAPSRCAV